MHQVEMIMAISTLHAVIDEEIAVKFKRKISFNLLNITDSISISMFYGWMQTTNRLGGET
jgi:hypothetical protein